MTGDTFGGVPFGGGGGIFVSPDPPVEVGGSESTAELRGSSPEPRSIDPSECWIRHVVRGAEGDPSATALARVHFVSAESTTGEDGLNTRQGWQQAQVSATLSDDGSFVLVLPNVAGDDGVLHRHRFRILTDGEYEPGEEWIEFYRDPNDLIFVGTPTDYEKTTSTVTIKGADLPSVLAGAISTEVDVWDATAPADVLRHYTRLPVLAYGADLSTTQTGGAGWSAGYTQALAGLAADCWTIEARLRWTSARPVAAGASYVALELPGGAVWVDLFNGATFLSGAAEREVTNTRTGLLVPGPVDLRIVAHYDHIFAFVAGELVAEYRRAAPFAAPNWLTVKAWGGTVAIDGLHVETLAPFAGRGASAVSERNLPGLPPPTGLRAQYWNAAGPVGQLATGAGRVARLWPLLAGEDPPGLVEPQLDHSSGAAPNMAGAYCARWSGAVYLDLAASDRNLRLTGVLGDARVYVGRTLRGDEAASTWGAGGGATLTTPGLRAWLGTSVSGWYPLVIEQLVTTNALGITLSDRAGAGAYSTIPTSRLSPIGVYGDVVRLTSHRQVLGDVAEAFGYQWRVEPRSLESGEFPGQLSFKALVGRQTSLVIDDDAVGTEAQVSGAAGDVMDGLLVDAAGISDPQGAGQLTAQTIDYARAANHMALRQVYESLADITQDSMLRVRASSILALRSSPNEQVGVRPRGQRDLVDTFPLSGALARMDWQPGDAVVLELDSIDVRDLSPRQLTSVSWPLRRDGIGAPTVGFRQRPRSPRAALRRLSATIYGPRRTYQGSMSIITGSLGGAFAVSAGGGPEGGCVDGYSRAGLPGELSSIVRAVAVVHGVTGTGWRLEVTGVPLGVADGAVSGPGRYDVTRQLRAVAPGAPYAYARLRDGAAGAYTLTLEIWVVV